MTLRTRQIGDFLLIALAVAFIDLAAKETAAALLAGGAWAPEALRSLRFVLVHNELSAFSVSLGPLTRELNVAATAVALLLAVPACDRLRIIDPLAPLALGLIAGAGLANLLSMLSSPAGVIDFIAVPAGNGRELVFNLADVAAYLGLALLIRTAATLCRLLRLERETRLEI